MRLQQLVTQLRENELESIRSEQAAGRADHILKTLDERGSAQELVRQQYTGRYPFELLQNANDAAADCDEPGRAVKYVLTESALIVGDQGAGFGAEQIEAICSLGRSSKDPRKTIGYKGLGFKSIGQITESPQIISGDVRFQFDEPRATSDVQDVVGELPVNQKLPVYAFPFALDDSDLGDDRGIVDQIIGEGFRTVLRLPFKGGVSKEKVDADLHATLNPRLLLFLDATDQLQLIGTSNDFSAISVRQQHKDCVETLLEADKSEHWLVFEQRLKIPNVELVRPLGTAWSRVKEVRVAAAIPLGDDGRPSRGSRQPLHVYFPTEEQAGFPVHLRESLQRRFCR